ALGGLDPERGVAARSAAARNEVGLLHFFRQREECLRLLLRAMDEFVRNAVVGDDRESVVLEAAAQLLRELVGMAVGVLQRDGRDVVVGDCGHETLLSRKVREASGWLMRRSSGWRASLR